MANRKRNKIIKRDWLKPCLSALLLSLAFSFEALGVLAWVGLIPFFISLENKSAWQRWCLSFCFAFVFFLTTLYWLIHISFIGLVLLCMFLALELSVFGLFIPKISHSGSLLYVPLLWIILERLRGILFSGFGWALLGYTQFKNLALIQIAEIFGVWGVSFIIVFVNLALTQIVRNNFKLNWRRSCVWGPVACLIASYSWGLYALNQPYVPLDITVSIVQPNIPQEQKWDIAYTDSILEKFRKLTIKANSAKPELIIWPETSVPGYLLDEPKLYRSITALSKQIQTHLLVGSPREDYETSTYYNTAFIFGPGGHLKRFHDKIHLVPFGEYIPYKNIFWFLQNSPIADFSPGSRFTLFEVPGANKKLLRFGVLICFEDIFPQLVRQFRKNGADFLVTITNEAWFKQSREPLQHTAISVFRAIENRCWFIRCANTGVSCFIDPHGKIRKKIEKNNKDIFIEGVATLNLGS